MHCRSRATDWQSCSRSLSIGALLVPPILTAASVVLRRPNIAAPVANMTALLAPSDTERQALRTSRLDAARQKLTSYLIAHREAARFLVAVPNANVAAPLIISTGLPVMAIGGYLGDDPILTSADIERLAADRQLRFVMLGGFTLAPAKQAAALDPIARWVRANGRPVDPKLWRLYASSSAPYRINLGNEWVEVPPPELFDLWDKANPDRPDRVPRRNLDKRPVPGYPLETKNFGNGERIAGFPAP